MPINRDSLVAQLEAEAKNMRQASQQEKDDLRRAVEQYRAASQDKWLTVQELSRGKQAGAMPVEPLNTIREIGPAPQDYVVVATDGSAIPADRHGGMARYSVINIGQVVLGYGARLQCLIESDTRFYGLDVDQDESGEQSDFEQRTLTSQILEVRGSVDEMAVALKLAEEHKATLALRDGPLTLWASSILNSKEGKALTKEYLGLIEQFSARGIPVIGYTSNTRSDVVITALREMSHQSYRGLVDAQLFWEVLETGECSPAFRNSPRHPKDAALTEQIYFMYLKTEDEIVRLEIDRHFLNSAQLIEGLAIIGKQIKLGQGYPVALMEAHESAVLRGSDRDLLRILLEDYGLIAYESQKGLSKRVRAI